MSDDGTCGDELSPVGQLGMCIGDTTGAVLVKLNAGVDLGSSACPDSG